jgi:hypothetical protein
MNREVRDQPAIEETAYIKVYNPKCCMFAESMLLSLPALQKFNELMISAKVDKNPSLHCHIPVVSDLYRIREKILYK